MNRPFYPLFKRLFDIGFSLLALTVALPLMVVIAFLIKVTSSGPIFYKSLRVGKHYKPFLCYKFRTMVRDADDQLERLFASDPQKETEWQLYMKLQKDPRITKIGHFLRKSSLDELPQFLNVLKNEMSIVGPRPIALEKCEGDIKSQMEKIWGGKTDRILSIKPGITGLWQTSGRSFISLEKRRQIEICYVRKQSFFLDMALVIKTLPTILFSKGAF